MKALVHTQSGRDARLHSFRFYHLLVHVFVVVLLISNLVGQKICIVPFIEIGGEQPRISGAQLLFPITYIFGDIFTEVYGYAATRRAIWIGFFANVLMTMVAAFVVWFPAAPEFTNQGAFEAVFYTVPRFVLASLVAFWAGEFTNSYVMAKMKIWTGGRWLWTRTIGSTAAGQLVDTVLVIGIAFGGAAANATMLRLIFWGYLSKVLYEALATPITYLVVARLKRAEGVDVYDRGTDFNPFARTADLP